MEYVIATRPWSFTASLLPVLIGNALAATQVPSAFSWTTFFVTTIGILAIHAAGNLTNTYYDFVTGNDKKETSGDRTLFDLPLKPAQILVFSLGCYVVASIVAAYVLYNWGYDLLWLFVFGIFLTFSYTGTPLRLKARALGDAVIFLCFGPLPMLGVFFMQTRVWSVLPLAFSVPLGLLAIAILHANNTRDIKADSAAGITTVAILLGRTNSYYYYAFLLLFSYFWVVFSSFFFSYYLLLVGLSLPNALGLLTSFKNGKLDQLTEQTAQFGFMFGMLFFVALCLKFLF